MLIKEYRIPLPLLLEEYRIAQLYMIQKKSREESEGHDSAVEILENRPYTDGPQGSGQYTYKIFHIGRHLPSWFRSIAPKTALEVHEESWNAYPYTKTKFSVPYVEKFSLEVETVFEQDGGHQENIFQLKRSDLRQREVDVIDIVRDQLTGSDYKIEEDPCHYVSQRTGRGPLDENWTQHPPNDVIMCAYKLIKVEFRYWGLQSKVERFIHDYGLRRVMLRAHRQAWTWQDEWEGLTMRDIRRLERETQLILQRKLGRVPEGQELEEEEEEEEEEEGKEKEGEKENVEGEGSVDADGGTGHSEPLPDSISHPPSSRSSVISTTSTQRHHSHPSPVSILPATLSRSLSKSLSEENNLQSSAPQSHEAPKSTLHPTPLPMLRKSSLQMTRKRELRRDRHSTRRRSEAVLPMSRSHSKVEGDSDGESMYSARPEWALDRIAISDSDSELEFFDARETASGVGSGWEYEEARSQSEEGWEEEEEGGATALAISSSFQSLQDLSEEEESGAIHTPEPPKTLEVDLLFLVLQGGATVHSEYSVGRTIDYRTLRSNLAEVAQLHFHSAVGRWALRQVPCPNLTTPAFQTLCDLSPVPVTLENLAMDLQPSATSLHHCPSPSFPSSPSSYSLPSSPAPASPSCFPTHLPVAAMPLLTTQAPGYADTLKAVATSANRVFQEFQQSPEGRGFGGQVCLITDCMGSIVAYDILSSHPHTLSSSPTSPSPARSLGKPLQHPSPLSSPHSSPITPTMQPRKYSKSFSEDLEMAAIKFTAPSTPQRKLSVSLSPLPLSFSPHPPSSPCLNVGFDFGVTHFFSLGSSLGLVLASRQMALCRHGAPAPPPPRPNCAAYYNLCYGRDPLASRVEPLLDPRFAQLPPIPVPVYRLHPKGLAELSSLQEAVIQHPYLFGAKQRPPSGRKLTRKKSVSTECVITVEEEGGAPIIPSQSDEVKPFSVWWSRHRLDYLLESPLAAGGSESLPATAITHVIHSSYWEAKEVISFILRQVLHHDSTAIVRGTGDGREVAPFIPPDCVIKWSRRRTAIKIKRLSPNHRASDVLALESGPLPTVHAKFQYGPLDMISLAKELVDVFVLVQRGKYGSWQHLDTMATDKHGKVSYTLSRRLPAGLHPVKLLVKGDHTTAWCNMFILPLHTEAVVFSVDGALAQNFSLSGRDMKCKPGAVEVARHWKDRGYLLIYLTGRPDMQKEYVMSFLASNAFPLGLVACSDSISTDPHVKTLYLARLIREAKVIIQAAYGSQRHLSVYTELGLQRDQIYILSKKSSKRMPENCQMISGYQEHLAEFASSGQRSAVSNVYSLLGQDTCFALPGNQKPERRRKSRGSLSLRKHAPKPSAKKETTV